MFVEHKTFRKPTKMNENWLTTVAKQRLSTKGRFPTSSSSGGYANTKFFKRVMFEWRNRSEVGLQNLRRTTKRNCWSLNRLPVLTPETFHREAHTNHLISSWSDNCLEFILYGYLPAKTFFPAPFAIPANKKQVPPNIKLASKRFSEKSRTGSLTKLH